jgi:hypothetical protein
LPRTVVNSSSYAAGGWGTQRVQISAPRTPGARSNALRALPHGGHHGVIGTKSRRQPDDREPTKEHNKINWPIEHSTRAKTHPGRAIEHLACVSARHAPPRHLPQANPERGCRRRLSQDTTHQERKNGSFLTSLPDRRQECQRWSPPCASATTSGPWRGDGPLCAPPRRSCSASTSPTMP